MMSLPETLQELLEDGWTVSFSTPDENRIRIHVNRYRAREPGRSIIEDAERGSDALGRWEGLSVIAPDVGSACCAVREAVHEKYPKGTP